MSMLNQRLQVMVSQEQRARLDVAARRRGTSVATLVREAIDEHVGVPTRGDRQDALAAIREMQGRFVTPEQLEAIIDEERAGATLPG
jgi:predicted DNA-binding protein